MIAELTFGGQKIRAALDRGVSLAIAVDFSGAGPRHFGAGAPSARRRSPVGNFSGSVATGASANCSTITLIPHCQMTHTESVAHLTRESGDAWRVVPRGLLPAVVVSVMPGAGARIEREHRPAALGHGRADHATPPARRLAHGQDGRPRGRRHPHAAE